MRFVINCFCLLLLFLSPAGAAGGATPGGGGGTAAGAADTGQSVIETRKVSLCASSQGAALRSYQLWVQGVFLPLGKVIHVRVGGREAAVLNAIQLSRGQVIPIPAASLGPAGGAVEFAGPAAETGSQPWEIRTAELTPIYALPVTGPVTSKCGENPRGVSSSGSNQGKGKTSFSFT